MEMKAEQPGLSSAIKDEKVVENMAHEESCAETVTVSSLSLLLFVSITTKFWHNTAKIFSLRSKAKGKGRRSLHQDMKIAAPTKR